jgi:hypothetical protein
MEQKIKNHSLRTTAAAYKFRGMNELFFTAMNSFSRKEEMNCKIIRLDVHMGTNIH